MSRAVTWLGHGTVRMETAGGVLITDPVLRRRVGHLTRRVQRPGVSRGLVSAHERAAQVAGRS